jgi:hypothetical protein
MSRGLGKIQLKVIEIIKKNRVVSTKKLCREIFRLENVQKKHRVAVIRALKTVAKAKKLNIWRAVYGDRGRPDDIWFDYDRSAQKRLPNIAPADKPRPRK